MAKTNERYYLDTVVILALLKGEKDKVPGIRYVFEQATSANATMVTSVIGLAECLHLGQQPVDAATEEKIIKFFDWPKIEVLELSHSVALRTRKLRQTYGLGVPDPLKLWDAIHFASALERSCSRFYTYDPAFDNLKVDFAGKIQILPPMAPQKPLPLFGSGDDDAEWLPPELIGNGQ